MRIQKFNKHKKIVVSALALLLLSLIGITYAFFSANIIGGESGSTISIGGAEMTILYADASPAINVSNIYPRNEAWATKTFTLTGTNTADFDMAYQIALVVDSNTFTDNALTYTLFSENTSDSGTIAPSITEQVGIPTGGNSIILGEGKFIQKETDIFHTYTFSLFFPETGLDQNKNQEKVFTAHIVVNPFDAIRNGVRLAMQTVAKDGTVTGITEVPSLGNYFLKKNCIGADVTYENNTLNATATDVLAYCSVELKEPYNIEITNGDVISLLSIKPLVNSTANHFILNSKNLVGYNDDLDLSITPHEHYVYDNTICTGTHGIITNIGNIITVPNVKSDMQCTINMDTEKYNVVVSSPLNYTLGSYNNVVNYNGTATITFVPNNGYSYESATCTGTHGNITNNGNTLTISNVTSDINCTINMNITLATKILGIGNTNVGTTVSVPGRSISSSTEAVLASAPDDYGTSYYYRGAVENNYVSFANMCWRIVRVTGNGAIKLVLYNYNPNNVSNPCDSSQDGTDRAFARYNGATYTSSFNSIYNQNAYLGFMYGFAGASSYAEEHANTNKSTILANLETWYKLKLSDYSNKLADIIWCNDKSVTSDSTYDPFGTGNTRLGYGAYTSWYNAAYRLYPSTNANPSLVCPSDLNGGKLSKYTTDDVINGNAALDYKIGLLTVDEVAFAGAMDAVTNETFYLYKNTGNEYWWTMSPFAFNSGYANGWYITYKGAMSRHTLNSSVGLRPAISLIPSITATGSGTQADPWRVL